MGVPDRPGSDHTLSSPGPQAPKLLERLRMLLEMRRYRPETIGRFVEWSRQYILFHGKRHPATMGREQIEAFLLRLAQLGYGTELQAQARQALGFLYREVLGQALAWPEIARTCGGGGGRVDPPNPPLARGGEGAARLARGGEGAGAPKLLERAVAVLRGRHYSLRTEQCYVDWMRRYILFHNKRHPLEMGGREVEEFLTHLAVKPAE